MREFLAILYCTNVFSIRTCADIREMWVTSDNLYVLAAQNSIGDYNSVILGRLTDTLLGYSLLKNQPDSMQDNRYIMQSVCH